MLTKPRYLLHLEGASILVLAIFLYRAGHFPWWMFAALLLVPDLFMLGYLWNARFGSTVYNSVHTLSVPVLLFVASQLFHMDRLAPFILIWIAHIGMDRMLGFGLKYPTQFKDTHLQHV
jgi:hypothetical protein